MDEFGNKPFSFRIDDDAARATSSVINPVLMAVERRDCRARRKASRRCVKDVDRVGTGRVKVTLNWDLVKPHTYSNNTASIPDDIFNLLFGRHIEWNLELPQDIEYTW
jgi:hypothetical protein